MTPDENLKRIGAFRERQNKNAEIIKLFKHNLEQVLSEDEDHLYYYLTVLFGEKVYRAYLDWAAEAETLLRDYNRQKASMKKSTSQTVTKE
ncbi:MAG: putative transcriptional regulator [Anaerocolumna sp.]|nr:putative transcriptional regulator [Anaerocolumna sp.]